ncbi:hypothetical protein FVE85_2216 [Porphyridium purpureum]|uniref:SGNH hydrolase-type esterase domain-containing protein n=1 Tax=Porphyridium purpureum TaxID=35688 RepID=A0A5J4YWW6_PORPP|nr:hypothetical protein FVE85_2216 [Porphyridium purpureum]|eukprot:POR7959..scf209_3
MRGDVESDALLGKPCGQDGNAAGTSGARGECVSRDGPARARVLGVVVLFLMLLGCAVIALAVTSVTTRLPHWRTREQLQRLPDLWEELDARVKSSGSGSYEVRDTYALGNLLRSGYVRVDGRFLYDNWRGILFDFVGVQLTFHVMHASRILFRFNEGGSAYYTVFAEPSSKCRGDYRASHKTAFLQNQDTLAISLDVLDGKYVGRCMYTIRLVKETEPFQMPFFPNASVSRPIARLDSIQLESRTAKDRQGKTFRARLFRHQESKHARRLLVIGDSESAGFCDDGPRHMSQDRYGQWREFSRFSDSWVYKLVTSLRWEYDIVAVSGRGVVRNFYESGPYSAAREVMSSFVSRALQSVPGSHERDVPFLRKPDIVIIFLGCNDFFDAAQDLDSVVNVRGFEGGLQSLATKYAKAGIKLFMLCGGYTDDRQAPCGPVSRVCNSLDSSGSDCTFLYMPRSLVPYPQYEACAAHVNSEGQDIIAQYVASAMDDL